MSLACRGYSVYWVVLGELELRKDDSQFREYQFKFHNVFYMSIAANAVFLVVVFIKSPKLEKETTGPQNEIEIDANDSRPIV